VAQLNRLLTLNFGNSLIRRLHALEALQPGKIEVIRPVRNHHVQKVEEGKGALHPLPERPFLDGV